MCRQNNFPTYNGGGGGPYKEFKELKIKQEAAEQQQAWNQTRLESCLVLSSVIIMVCTPQGTTTQLEVATLLTPATGEAAGPATPCTPWGHLATRTTSPTFPTFTIPRQVAEHSVGYKIMLITTLGYPAMSTMTPLVNNPYSVQQPSPDSQSFANMNLASPQHKQGNN